MPLIKSGSKSAVSKNISEMMHSFRASGSLGTSHPKTDKKAQSQAVAIALSNARKYGRAAGGIPYATRFATRDLAHSGMIHSSIPGRTDKIPMSVKPGSYVIPADVVSGIGQNNSMAGAAALDRMFKGPYWMKPGGIPTPKVNYGHMTAMPHMRSVPGVSQSATSIRQKFAKGGSGHAKIIAAGGEYVISPEAIRILGGGDIDKGHAILDAFVLHARKHNVKKLRSLPGPKKS